MFLNPDAQLLPGAVDALLAALALEQTAVVGAVHVTGSGAVEANSRRRSSPHHEVLELLPSAERWLPQRFNRDVPITDPVYRKGGPVAYVQGACFAMMTSIFRDVGGFDERFFLYSEEEHLADRVAARGGRSILVSDAQVRHQGHSSTNQVQLLAVHHFYRSRFIFYAERDGFPRAVLFALALSAAGLTRLGVDIWRRADSSRRPFAWFRSVVGGLWAGLAAARNPPETLIGA